MRFQACALIALAAALGACSPKAQSQADAAGRQAVAAVDDLGAATATSLHKADRAARRDEARAKIDTRGIGRRFDDSTDHFGKHADDSAHRAAAGDSD